MKAFIVAIAMEAKTAPGEMPNPELREDETRQRAFSFRKLSQQRRVRTPSFPEVSAVVRQSPFLGPFMVQ